MIARNGEVVAKGACINNHLYKLQNLTVVQPHLNNPTDKTNAVHLSNEAGPAVSWETWHKIFGHIGVNALQALLTRHLVEGFGGPKQPEIQL
jgi:hypothetical protein